MMKITSTPLPQYSGYKKRQAGDLHSDFLVLFVSAHSTPPPLFPLPLSVINVYFIMLGITNKVCKVEKQDLTA